MRFRLLRRRLTVSSPRMAVRSALPWPFRWAMFAVALGFSAAIALWAFEFGKNIAGVEGRPSEQTVQLRLDLAQVRKERDQAQRIANTSQTLQTAGRAAQEQLAARNRQLEQEILSLRDDLGFFEQLIPMTGGGDIAVRGLEAAVGEDKRLKWRILLIQPRKNAGEFKGELELKVAGLLNGKPWQMSAPAEGLGVKFTRFGRFQGFLDVPAQVVVKTVSVRVMQGSKVKATQSVKL